MVYRFFSAFWIVAFRFSIFMNVTNNFFLFFLHQYHVVSGKVMRNPEESYIRIFKMTIKVLGKMWNVESILRRVARLYYSFFLGLFQG